MFCLFIYFYSFASFSFPFFVWFRFFPHFSKRKMWHSWEIIARRSVALKVMG